MNKKQVTSSTTTQTHSQIKRKIDFKSDDKSKLMEYLPGLLKDKSLVNSFVKAPDEMIREAGFDLSNVKPEMLGSLAQQLSERDLKMAEDTKLVKVRGNNNVWRSKKESKIAIAREKGLGKSGKGSDAIREFNTKFKSMFYPGQPLVTSDLIGTVKKELKL